MSTCRKILLLVLFSIFVVCLAIGISACAGGGGDAGDGNVDSGYEDENDDSNDKKDKSSEETTVSVSSVSLNESSISLEVGETYSLVATISPSDATNKSVTWSSSKESVATVSDSGLVTAVSEGTATIIVSSADGGKTATCEVTVSEAETSIPVTSVSLNESSISLEVGETHALVATIFPSDATNKSVTWSSSKESVATVSDSGLVTAVSEGTATIIVSSADGGKTATCEVTVTYSYSSGDFVFEEYGNGYALTGYTGTSGVLYVPSEYNGKEVIAIGTMPTDTTLDTLYISGDGFYENKNIQQVILPESIRTINAGAFAYSSVTGVTIPSSCRAIYSYVFYGCTSLKTVVFNGGTVTAELFAGCDSLENIIVGEEATYSDGVFSSFSNLKTLTVSSLNTTARALFASSDEERQCYTFTISTSLGDLYPSSVTSQTADLNGTSVKFGTPASGCDWYYSSSTIVVEGNTYRYSFEAVIVSAWGETSVNGITYQYPTSVQIKVYLEDEGYGIPSDFAALTITDQQLSPTSGVLADCPFEIVLLNVCPIDYIYMMGDAKLYVDDFDYDDYVLAIVRTDGNIEYAHSVQNYISFEDQELLKTAGVHVVTLSYDGVSYLFAVELDEHVFEGLTFDDATFAYDGSAKYIYVNGAPGGAEVEYTNNGQIEIGEYIVTAVVTMQYYTPVTLTATLTIVQSSFDVTYVLNKDGAENDNPSQYEYGVTLTLNSPTCDYYSFAGWYLDSEFTIEITEIEAGTVGDVVLYAKWISVFIMSGNTITGVTDEVRSYTMLVVPEYVEGVEVKEIAEGALSGCSSLENMTLPFVGGSASASSASASTLFGYIFGSGSYSGGTGVTQSYGSGSVTYYIPGNLTEVTITGGQILYGAFYNCSFLEKVILSGDIAGIGDYAFYGGTSLASVSIPDCAETIGSHAFYGCENLTAVSVPSGVETIGEYAFANCTFLKDIEMGSGLETIGEYAFLNCSSLTAVSVSSGVTVIGNGAFYECVSLESFEIGNGVTKIGDYAFYGCVALASITIPDGVSIVESYVFYGCLSLTAISIPNGVETIDEYAFYNCTNLADLTIGDGVTAIADYAFYGCESLTVVTIPGGVETIGDYAFANCAMLKDIAIGSGIETIGSYAFANCSSLVSIEIPNSVTIIGGSCFSGCGALESITIPFVGGAAGADSASSSTLFGYIFGTTSYSGGTSTKQYYRSSSYSTYYIPSGLSDVTVSSGQILYGAFYGCSHLENISIPDSVISIGDYAFYDCSSLIHITISEEVTNIGNYAFANCSSLTEIGFNAKNMGNLSSSSLVFENAGEDGDGIAVTIGSKVEKIPNYLFQKSKVVSVDFDEESQCASVGAGAFYYCKSLKSIVLPYSVTSIGGSAFYYCNNLSSITIPDTVTSIGSYAFYYCVSLKSVTIPSGLASIESHTFESCLSLTTVTIPSYVTNIGSGAFTNCSSLVTLVISENVTSFGNDAFYYCKALAEIYYDAANADDLSNSNDVFGYVGQDGSGITVTIGPDVTYIPSYLFSPSATSYSSLSPNITAVIFEEGEICEIGRCAFYGCVSLAAITIPERISSIGDYAFGECVKLTAVIVPSVATSIGNYAFYDCTALMSVTISYGVETIGDYAFSNCFALATIAIPDSVESIGTACFSGCSSLENMTLPFVGGSALAASTSSSTLFGYIFGSSSYSGGTAVEQRYSSTGSATYCIPSNLTEVTITGGQVLYGAFYNCSFLERVILPSDIAGIGDYAFFGCTSLTSMTIPENVTAIGDYAFGECLELTAVMIPNGVGSLGGGVFYDCTSLNSVTLGSDVETIGGYMFYGCTSLSCVTILGGIVTIGEYAFANCASLMNIEMGDVLESIGEYAFLNCSSLTVVNVPSSVTSIGSSAFSGCSSLESITLPFVGGSATASSASASTLFGYIFGSSSYSGGTGVAQSYGSGSVTYYIPGNLAEVTITGGQILYGAFYNCSLLESVILSDNVVGIGDYAFYGCTSLASVSIPNCAESIGSHAFYGCENLTAVTIPSGVETIGEYAFANCVALTSLAIGEGVTSIGEYAFYECALTGFTIGKGMTSIGKDAFARCSSLNEIFYNAAYLDDLTENSRIFEESGQDSEGIVVTIGADVKMIPDYLFYETNVTSVVFEEGSRCESIGGHAFQYCRSLMSIVIPSNVTSIGERAFEECSSLTEIYYNARALTELPSDSESVFNDVGKDGDGIAVTIGSDVEMIPDNLFDRAYVKSVVFEEESRCKSIGNSAFHNCSLLTEIEFPDSVTSIGESAFSDCNALTSITIGANVTSIGRSAFESCSSLTEIYYNVADLTDTSSEYIFKNAGQEDEGMVVTIGADVRTIPGYMFYESKVKNVVFEDGSRCTSIGDYAFYECKLLKSIDIPDSVTNIGESAFCYCSALTSITIVKGVTNIGDYAFRGCTTLVEIYYNAANVDDFTWYSWIFSEAGQNKSGIAVTIGADVERIPNYLFYDVKIKSVDFENGSICREIGEYAFTLCNISTISLPGGLTHIGAGAFDGCGSLTAVYFSDLETWLEIEFDDMASNPLSNGADLYLNGTLVTELILPDGIEKVSDYAFFGCGSLTSITFSESVTSIGDSAFSECASLATVVLPATLTSMGSWVFSRCKSLTSVTIPEGVESIGEGAFNNCSSLTTVVLPDSVTYIGSDAFSYCSSLVEINIPERVTRIEASTFEYCDGMKSITIPDSITYIGSRAFSTCTALTEIIIPNSVITIDEYAFEYCDHMTSIIIPSSVTSIGYGAFRNCLRLTKVYYFGTEDEWEALQDNIGESNSRLTSATIYYYSETKPSENGNYWHYDETTGEVTTW